jgi:hypothetical protein
MNRKVLMAGASLAMLVGLSACSSTPDPEDQQVRAALQAKLQSPTSSSAPLTPQLDHNIIKGQLDRMEGKLDNLQPTTKTVTQKVTVATATKTVTKTSTTTVTPTTTTTTVVPPPSSTTNTQTSTPAPPPPPTQTLGVGGVARPADAKDLPAKNDKGIHQITSAGVYDCKGQQVARIDITTSGVTVQNCMVVANSQYGIYSSGDDNIIQNNDIKGLKPTGDGDMNAITFFGNKTKIQFNTAIDFVSGSPGDSHTDFVQTWVSTNHPTASSEVVIRSNKATGPANPTRSSSIASIHQCVMVEDQGRGGNSGGSTAGMKNWLIIANIFSDSWNQCIKNDGVDGMVVTKNDFQGSSNHVMEQANGSGLQFFSDNKIGSGYGNIGVPVTAGAGPN